MTLIKSPILPPRITPEMTKYFDEVEDLRRKSIIKMAAEMKDDMLTAMLIHDAEVAPRSTNREMLRRIGIDLPTETPDNPEGLEDFLRRTIAGLSLWNICIVNTDCMSDEQLAVSLLRMLDESVAMISPAAGVLEYVDFVQEEDRPSICDRDRFLPKFIDFGGAAL